MPNSRFTGESSVAEMAVTSMLLESPILLDINSKLNNDPVTGGLVFVILLPKSHLAERHMLLKEIKDYLSVKLSEFYDV